MQDAVMPLPASEYDPGGHVPEPFENAHPARQNFPAGQGKHS
jgi:hypothetical protein